MLTAEDKKLLLSFARRAITRALTERRECPADAFAAEASANMRRKMACFVTLNRRSTGALRGCIGEIRAFRPLYESVTARAQDAAFSDSRFSPLTAKELDDIVIEISALTPERSVSSYKDIIIGRHGMILSLHGRSAVFLPQVAPELGWDLETTLSELACKAGLPWDAWKSSAAKFSVFEAIVFSEDCPA
ncbi:MAG: AmmeMemoRadiSam system protein A [Oligosphaeraceae bacterium]|nr:AmmeMemoRadiSam system protein A [Oligosphaeraceae bacterium]